jgi:signal transduction histidine kinase
MKISIRVRLTLWYSVIVALIVVSLGLGIFFGASWGLRRIADQELTSGIDGVATFLNHKLAIHEMNNLGEELREHSALLPRGKMFRVSNPDGSVVYQPDAMAVVPSLHSQADQTLKQSVSVGGRSFRTIGRLAQVGSYTFGIQVAVDQTEYARLMEGLDWLLILSIPAAGLLAACAGYWMSGRALSPIHQITEATHSIDAGSLSKRLPLRGTQDELDRLSNTINHMLDRIAVSYERIAQFTADASHELRTPVALIRSNAELLLMSPTDSQRTAEGLSDILLESEYMARLIGDLLTLARGSGSDKSIPMELFELGESIDAVIVRARSLAATKDITLIYRAENQIAPLRGNRDIVERLLMIFIDNAVRYTPWEGHIELMEWVSNDLCGFIVRDTGMGIAAADHQRIFERFFRVDTARTPRDGGFGLGLSIAKSLVEMHGGTIRVDSELGEGAAFEVAFPRADIKKVLMDKTKEAHL